jgi:hypothetical protein
MTSLITHRSLSRILCRLLPGAAALGVWPLVSHATPDLTIPAVVCVPGDTVSMNAENKPLTAGVVRKEGRNTPPRMYYCPVFNPDFTAAQPSWRHLRLTYADNSGIKGNISARLFAKSRAKAAIDPPLGTTFKLAQVLSVPAPTVNVVSVALPGTLDFYRFTYWLVLDVASPTWMTSAVIDVHEIQLTD